MKTPHAAPSLPRALRRFMFRVRCGRGFGAASQAFLALALWSAGLLLVLRLFGLGSARTPLWLLLFLPALAFGLWSARRTGFGADPSAVYLDRRLRLGGLLLSALERDPGVHAARIERSLTEAQRVLPTLRPGPMLGRLGLGLAVLGGVLALPAPDPDPPANPLAAEVLAELEQKLATLDAEHLDEQRSEELRERLDDLQQRFDLGRDVTWTDLDAIDSEVAQARSLSAARLAKTAQDLASFAKDGSVPSGAGKSAPGAASAERMAELLQQAAAVGLLEDLPDSLQRDLGLGRDGAGADGGPAGARALAARFDSERLRQLAAALAQAAGDRLARLDPSVLGEGVDLAALDALLRKGRSGRTPGTCTLCGAKSGTPDKDCPG